MIFFVYFLYYISRINNKSRVVKYKYGLNFKIYFNNEVVILIVINYIGIL